MHNDNTLDILYSDIVTSCLARGEGGLVQQNVEVAVSRMFDFYTNEDTLKLIGAHVDHTDVSELDALAAQFIRNSPIFERSYIDSENGKEYFITTEDTNSRGNSLLNAFQLTHDRYMFDAGIYEYEDMN